MHLGHALALGRVASRIKKATTFVQRLHPVQHEELYFKGFIFCPQMVGLRRRVRPVSGLTGNSG